MSAPLPDNTASLSNSGYEDGLGRRTLVFDRVSGTTIERLTLRSELSLFERALTERAERLAAFDDERFARVRGVQRDPVTGALTVDSDVVGGARISDLLDAVAEGAEGSTGAGLDVAVGFLLDVLPALGALHTAVGFTHGTVGPGRALLTPAGRVVVADALFGDAVQRLQFTPARLWAEFGVATTATAGPARLDAAADLAQAGMTALMLALGRPLRRDEFPAGLPSAMSEVLEIAQIRGSASFASRLEQFLQQILPLAGHRPYSNAKDAFNELRDFAGIELGVANCRSALGTFFREAGNALEAQRILLASAMPESVPEPEPIAQAEPKPSFEIDPVPPPPVPEPVFVASPVVEPPLQPIAPIAIEAAAPRPEPEPVPAFVASAAEPQPQVEPVMASMFEAPSQQDPVEAAEVAEVPTAASARRKRQRGPRAKRDKLRSNAAPPAPLATPAPPTPPPVVQTPLVPPPLVVAPPPVEPPPPRPPAPPIRMPFAAPPGGGPEPASPYTSDRFWEAPPSAPVHVAAPVPIAAAPIPIASKPAPPRIAVAPPATVPLRVKAQPPAGYVPPQAHRPSRAPEPVRADERMPFGTREGSARRSFPWKIAAAALVVIAAGIAASQGGYLPDRGASAAPKPEAAAAAPVPAVEPAARAVGTIVISSTPSGAKVLLDGAAAGETPVTLSDVPAGRRVVTLVSTAGTVRRTVRVVAGKSISLDVPVYSGFVNIIAPVILEVAIGGRSLGTTEQGRLLLPPGRHELTLSNKDLDYTATHMVEIESGEEFRTKVEPRATVSINAIPWAEVWIDGQKAGDTPLAKMTMVLGTHDIVFKHPQYPERRITATIKASSPSALSVDFTKPERP